MWEQNRTTAGAEGGGGGADVIKSGAVSAATTNCCCGLPKAVLVSMYSKYGTSVPAKSDMTKYEQILPNMTKFMTKM